MTEFRMIERNYPAVLEYWKSHVPDERKPRAAIGRPRHSLQPREGRELDFGFGYETDDESEQPDKPDDHPDKYARVEDLLTPTGDWEYHDIMIQTDANDFCFSYAEMRPTTSLT